MFIKYDDLSDLQKQKVTQEQFEEYIEPAEAIIHNVTDNYWMVYDHKHESFQVKQTKKAIFAQLMWFVEHGGSSVATFKKPSSFSAGRTSVTERSGREQSSEAGATSLVNPEVYIHLEGTGLLFRGVHNPYYRGYGWSWL